MENYRIGYGHLCTFNNIYGHGTIPTPSIAALSGYVAIIWHSSVSGVFRVLVRVATLSKQCWLVRREPQLHAKVVPAHTVFLLCGLLLSPLCPPLFVHPQSLGK